MYLHNNREYFKKIILEAKIAYNIPFDILEKDYYVFMTLKLIKSKLKEDEVVFKGGTSLSKAYNIIQRFSEDIDLCLLPEKIKSAGARKRLVEAVLESFDELGLVDNTTQKIEKHGVYNDIRGVYNSIVSTRVVESYIKVEMAHRVKEFPYELRTINSYLGLYLQTKYNAVNGYNLGAFNIYTVIPIRTFVDKLFAIADYYMEGKVDGYSRHLYDVYKLILGVDWNNTAIVNSILQLKEVVRLERQPSRKCLSAQTNVDLKAVIYEALQTNFYKADYQNTTQRILFENVTYEQCKGAILALLNIL